MPISLFIDKEHRIHAVQSKQFDAQGHTMAGTTSWLNPSKAFYQQTSKVDTFFGAHWIKSLRTNNGLAIIVESPKTAIVCQPLLCLESASKAFEQLLSATGTDHFLFLAAGALHYFNKKRLGQLHDLTTLAIPDCSQNAQNYWNQQAQDYSNIEVYQWHRKAFQIYPDWDLADFALKLKKLPGNLFKTQERTVFL